MWYHWGMKTPSQPCYKRHRFPTEIISHTVWLYNRFSLSYRDVEELLAERGIIVTYETIRQWCQKFGQCYANQLRRCRAQTGDKWHLDEVFLTINGKFTICGARLISMAWCWISWSRAGAIPRPPPDFSKSCYRRASMSHVSL